MIVRLIVLHLAIASMTAALAAGVDTTAQTPPLDTALPNGIFPNTWEITDGAGSTLASVGLLGLAGDTLLLTSAPPAPVVLSQVLSMRRRNGGEFWCGVSWGAGIAAPVAILGIIIGGTEPAGARSESYLISVAFWVGGALLGGIVGSFFPRTEEVVLAALPADERAGTVRAIIAEDAIERAEALEDRAAREARRAERAARRRKR